MIFLILISLVHAASVPPEGELRIQFRGLCRRSWSKGQDIVLSGNYSIETNIGQTGLTSNSIESRTQANNLTTQRTEIRSPDRPIENGTVTLSMNQVSHAMLTAATPKGSLHFKSLQIRVLRDGVTEARTDLLVTSEYARLGASASQNIWQAAVRQTSSSSLDEVFNNPGREHCFFLKGENNESVRCDQNSIEHTCASRKDTKSLLIYSVTFNAPQQEIQSVEVVPRSTGIRQ
ncbi:MAG: hypothetical protein K2Q26_12865 [Bdellovibrionales bacterium]|nr:hypothetical protein [Bdellovibrionales bacterium]